MKKIFAGIICTLFIVNISKAQMSSTRLIQNTIPELEINSRINCINGTIVIPESLKPTGEIGPATFRIEVYELKNIIPCKKECYQGTPVRFPAVIEYDTVKYANGNYSLPVFITNLNLNKFTASIYVLHFIPVFKTSWSYPFYDNNFPKNRRINVSNSVPGMDYGQIVFYPGDMIVFNLKTTSKNVMFSLSLLTPPK